MTRVTVGIHPEAEAELEAAFDYLEEQVPGLGLQLIERYREQIDRVLEFPDSGALLSGHVNRVRKYQLDQFPYALVVANIRGRPTIVAVAHGSREPEYWRHRLE